MSDGETAGPFDPSIAAATAAAVVDLCVPSDRDETVATLLHDLNQPLTALTNYLAAAQLAVDDGAAPEIIAGLLEDANGQGARARAIVRRLRDYLAH